MIVDYRWSKNYVDQLHKDSDCWVGKEIIPIVGPHHKHDWEYPGSGVNNRSPIYISNKKANIGTKKTHYNETVWEKQPNGLWKKVKNSVN